MDSRILIRSHLSKWPAYLAGFIGVLFLAGGVALAAIQGLNQKLETENAELKARLVKLEEMVAALTQAK